MATKKTPPKYVTIGNNKGSAMRLEGAQYYRELGAWRKPWKYIDDKLVLWSPDRHTNLHKAELIECTKEEWMKSNQIPYE